MDKRGMGIKMSRSKLQIKKMQGLVRLRGVRIDEQTWLR
jgi:hypothetical protein